MKKGKEEREEKEWRVTFWNVAGLKNKDKKFWRGLRNWDVMVLMEIWTKKKIGKELKKNYRRL